MKNYVFFWRLEIFNIVLNSYQNSNCNLICAFKFFRDDFNANILNGWMNIIIQLRLLPKKSFLLCVQIIDNLSWIQNLIFFIIKIFIQILKKVATAVFNKPFKIRLDPSLSSLKMIDGVMETDDCSIILYFLYLGA